MNTLQDFPYPYIVESMDRYYGVKSLSTQEEEKKKSKREKEKKSKKREKKRKKRKKLSILVATFWDYPHTGGLSNYLTTLRNGLKALGHKVDIISPNQFPEAEVTELREQIVPELKDFFTDRYGSINKKILQSSRLIYIYEQMMKKVDLAKYDILHAHDIFTANILGRCNEKYRKPLFFTPHGMFTLSRLKFNRIEKGSIEEVYYRQMEQKAIEFSSHLITLSESFREPLLEFGAEQSSISTVITGIDYKKPSKSSDLKKPDKLVISCVARLGPRKGHTFLLDALALLESKTKQIELWIIGDGEMREALEKQVASLKLSNVKFWGKRHDVPEFLDKTDIFVLPTINDNLPLTIIEAMHSGKAIVSTDCGGIPELIHQGKTGLIVEPGNTYQLAKALWALIKNPDLRSYLATNAYRFAEEHLTSETMVNKIETLYKQFLCGKEEM